MCINTGEEINFFKSEKNIYLQGKKKNKIMKEWVKEWMKEWMKEQKNERKKRLYCDEEHTHKFITWSYICLDRS